MTFDVTLPQDTSKIRNGPAEIRNNFSAIVTGDTTFTQGRVNLVDLGIPSTNATMMRLYADIDITTSPTTLELYCLDALGNDVQITKSGQFASIARASFDGTGATLGTAYGINSCTRNSTGNYTVIVKLGWLQTINYQVQVTTISNSTSHIYVAQVSKPVSINPLTTTSIGVIINDTTSSSVADKSFDIVIIGGR